VFADDEPFEEVSVETLLLLFPVREVREVEAIIDINLLAIFFSPGC